MPDLREPRSQRDLAEKFGCDPRRITEWKWMPEYREDVDRVAQEAISGENYSNALQGWMRRLPVQGSVADIKYLNEWKGIYKPTNRYSGKLTITPGVPKVVPPPPPKVITSTSIDNLGRKSFA